MRVRNAQAVVDVMCEKTPPLAQDVHAGPRDCTSADADDDGAPSGDETSCGSDADQTGDHAVDGADDGWFAVEDDVHGRPCEHGHGRTYVGIQDGKTGSG